MNMSWIKDRAAKRDKQLSMHDVAIKLEIIATKCEAENICLVHEISDHNDCAEALGPFLRSIAHNLNIQVDKLNE
jgi:hypothetical protein